MNIDAVIVVIETLGSYEVKMMSEFWEFCIFVMIISNMIGGLIILWAFFTMLTER